MRVIARVYSILMVCVLVAGFAVCGGGGGGAGDIYFADTDDDGYGDPGVSQVLDSAQAGWVLDSTDCDDSEPAVNPGALELCDNWTDDDCDDQTDCYDGVDCTADLACAACADGDSDGYFAVDLGCSGGNDCADADSTVNPGVDNDNDTIDACQDCDDFDTTTGTGTTEVCNDFDDDCDSTIDEDWIAGGTVTYIDLDGTTGLVKDDPCGTGACAGGTVVCGSDEVTLTCTTEGNASSETCDGADNNCDGQIDEGDPGGGVSCDGTDSDLCEEGTTSCVGGVLSCSDDDAENDLDLCNGVDDDCDPASADGSEDPGLGLACDGLDSDLCLEGTTTCVGVGLSCSDNDAENDLDLCNGVDDDCDPASADGSEDPLIGAGCDTGQQGVCAQGEYTGCSSSVLVCTQTVFSSSEVCNGLDDDCNGTPDDGDLCGGYLCVSGSCTDSCSSDTDCDSNYWCDGTNICQPPKPQGTSCVGDNECITGNCVDSVCCDTSCGSLCQSCVNDGSVGTCTLIVAGTDPDGECAGDSACDGSGGCITPIGGACTADIECSSGFCRDGFCCITSCDGTCQSCGISGNEGNCLNYPSGSDPDNECPGSSCDGAGACTP